MVKENYPQKARKSNHVDVQFSGHWLTNYGGLGVFSDFLFDKRNFSQYLNRYLHLGMGTNCSYSAGQVFGLVAVGFLCGHRCISHFETLSEDPLAKQLLGVDAAIDEDTIGRRLKRATPEKAQSNKHHYRRAGQARACGQRLAVRGRMRLYPLL